MSSMIVDLGARQARVAYLTRAGAYAPLHVVDGEALVDGVVSILELGDAERPIRVGNLVGFCAGQVEGEDGRWFGGNGLLEVESAGIGDLRLTLGTRNVPISFLVACFLHNVKALVEAAPDCDLHGPGEMVLVVPWWLDAAGRRALSEGAAAVGLATVRFVTHGTAIALASEAPAPSTPARHIVVCDLGTSRSDFALLRVGDGEYDVLAVASEDICGAAQSELVVGQLARELVASHGVTGELDWQARARLFEEAERVRTVLLTEQAAEVALHSLLPEAARSGDAREFGAEGGIIRLIRRDEYELWAAPLVRRLDTACNDLLSQVRLPPDAIDEVWVTGSFAEVGGVKERLAQLFGRAPRGVASTHAAVLGAARLLGESPPIVIEVAGSAIALKTGGVAPQWMIASDVGLPWREQRIITGAAGERELVFEVWAGDAYSDGRCVGRYLATLGSEATSAKPLLLVDVTLDVDGQLKLMTRDLLSGERVPLRSVQDLVSDRVAIKELLGRTYPAGAVPSP